MPPEIAFKVDVCNRRSLDEGVPGLLALLAEFEVPASFFVSFGPDNSGKAIKRVFRRGFLKKMFRTKAPQMYGVRTMLYGTLLPAPPVGESAPDLLRRVEDAGHEVGLHGFDHVGWHDGVARMSEQGVREAQDRAARLFEGALGHAPRFSGAPGWQVTDTSLELQDELGLDFASDTRSGLPFFPALPAGASTTLQVPTGPLTSDEVLGSGEARSEELPAWYLERLASDGVTVIGLHAEAEGIHFSEWLRVFLHELRARDARFVLVSEVARRTRDTAPRLPVVQREIPGRAGRVASPASTAGAA